MYGVIQFSAPFFSLVHKTHNAQSVEQSLKGDHMHVSLLLVVVVVNIIIEIYTYESVKKESLAQNNKR